MIKKILIILLIPLVYGCQTVNDKTNNIVEKEETYLKKFIHKKIDKVIQEFGEPTQYLSPDPESGGGKLIYNTKKLGIKGHLNNRVANRKNGLWFETGTGIRSEIFSGPRIGVDYAGRYWATKPYRFWFSNPKSGA